MMKIKYVNNNKDNRLYNIFLEVLEIDYTPYQLTYIDKLIIRDTINLIDRIKTSECKKILGRIGLKNYTNLKEKEVKSLLKEHLPKVDVEIVLEIYEDYKVVLDMYVNEVCEVLNISKWEYYKRTNTLDKFITGIVVGKWDKRCKKYSRRCIYKYKMSIEKQCHNF